MILNPFTHIRYYIYLLQLENYHLTRFFKVSASSLFHVYKELRLGITWTRKLQMVTMLAGILGIAILILALTLSSLGALLTFLILVLVFLLVSYFFFILLGFVVFLTLPVDRYVKGRLVRSARMKLENISENLTVIGITGSYGKTTMKEVIAASLSGKFKVLKTLENKNTPLGIARQILGELTPDTDIYVVEMGAYERGDIKDLVELVSPSIVVLVGINEAHLERQGSMENIIETKFEIVTHAPEGSYVVLNHDDELVRKHAGRFIRDDQTVVWFGRERGDVVARDVAPDEDGTISFKLTGEEDHGTFSSRFLASYIAVDAAAAVLVAKKLGVSIGSVKAGIREVYPAPHRLNPSERNGILFIDDAYNGNPAGAKEAIDVLDRFVNRRKIYVTPGLVEMGERTQDVHINIGRDLAKTADIVVLIENEATRIIKKTLREEGFPQENIYMFASGPAAHEGVRGMLRSGDVILFQNDAAENYL